MIEINSVTKRFQDFTAISRLSMRVEKSFRSLGTGWSLPLTFHLSRTLVAILQHHVEIIG